MNEDKRQHVHGMWAAVATKWGVYADDVETRAEALNAALLDGAGLRSSDRVLELACGPGGFGLVAAATGAHVVLSDVVPEMVDIAAKRAADRGLLNVTPKVLDIEDIDEPDASYDVVVSRDGLMFAVDPGRAFAEVARVLRPGGRVAVSVWAERERNPWLSVVIDAVSEQVGMQLPPPGMPGPFALADADQLIGLATDVGLQAATVSRVAAPLRAPTPEEWWKRTSNIAGPIAGIIARLPEAARAELAAKACRGAEPFRTEDGVEFPGEAFVLKAYRSAHE